MEKNVKILIAAAVIVIIVAVAAAAVLTGSGEEPETPDVPDQPSVPDEPQTIVCEDMLGNKVSMPYPVESMYMVGAGTLRFISYFGLAEQVCGSDQTAKGATYGSNTYMYAYDEHFNTQQFKDNSGQRGVVNLEEILTCNSGQKPQVVVMSESNYNDNLNTVDSMKRAGIVVFAIISVNSPINNDGTIHEDFVKQIKCIGKAFGKEDRAAELIDGYKTMLEDIKDLGKKGGEAYLGGLTVYRSRGLNHTALEYPPFVQCGLHNIAAEAGTAISGNFGGTMLKPEQLIDIINKAPDFKMFVDPAGWRLEKGLCSADVVISAALVNNGITNGLVLVPIHSYGTDYDNILASGYLVAGYMNGLDQNMIRDKIDSVYELFYGDKAVSPDGKKLYDEMADWYYQATHCRFGQLVTFRTDSIVMTDGTVMTV